MINIIFYIYFYIYIIVVLSFMKTTNKSHRHSTLSK